MQFSSLSKSKPGDVFSFYEILKKLGEGSYGKIYKVKNKDTEEIYAMKQMDKIKIQQNLELFKNEIEIMSILNHPNICKLYEVYEDSKFIYLIIEYCEGGELLDRITKKQKEGKLYTEKEAAVIFRQLIEAIDYIHEIGVIHRDLKPENILFSTKYENSPIKIIDFGISKKVTKNDPNKKIKLSSKVGTVYYMSPEIIKGSYSELCDVWACGIILYILLCGYPPFSGVNDKEIYNNIKECKLEFPQNEWKKISKNAKELIKKIICPEKNRISASQILHDKWFKGKSFESSINVKGFLNLNNLYFKEKITNKIKKKVYFFLISKLNENEIKNNKKIFDNIDNNNKNFITFDELKIAFEENKINKNQYIQIIEFYKNQNTENDGKIYFEEFLAGIMNLTLNQKQNKLNEAFQIFDPLNLGKISVKKFKEILNVNDEDINNDDMLKQLIKINEKTKENYVDYVQFVKIVFQ
jgi:calcium-dependent protein kinase